MIRALVLMRLASFRVLFMGKVKLMWGYEPRCPISMVLRTPRAGTMRPIHDTAGAEVAISLFSLRLVRNVRDAQSTLLSRITLHSAIPTPVQRTDPCLTN